MPRNRFTGTLVSLALARMQLAQELERGIPDEVSGMVVGIVSQLDDIQDYTRNQAKLGAEGNGN